MTPIRPQRRVVVFDIGGVLLRWDPRFLYRKRFEFLSWFDGVVVFGEEGVIKSDPRIFHVLLDRYRIDPREAVFVDDNPGNAEVTTTLGIHGIHFRESELLRREPGTLDLL